MHLVCNLRSTFLFVDANKSAVLSASSCFVPKHYVRVRVRECHHFFACMTLHYVLASWRTYAVKWSRDRLGAVSAHLFQEASLAGVGLFPFRNLFVNTFVGS